MTAAALVAGNTVIMKTGGQTPVIAAQLMEIFRSVGLPPGVLFLSAGLEKKSANTWCVIRGTNVIAFTGSLAVGLHINEAAAKLGEGQGGIKKILLNWEAKCDHCG